MGFLVTTCSQAAESYANDSSRYGASVDTVQCGEVLICSTKLPSMRSHRPTQFGNNFVFVAGTAVYRGGRRPVDATKPEVHAQMYKEIKSGKHRAYEEATIGIYSIIYFVDGVLHAVVDPLGLYSLNYATLAGGQFAISDSAYSVARAFKLSEPHVPALVANALFVQGLQRETEFAEVHRIRRFESLTLQVDGQILVESVIPADTSDYELDPQTSCTRDIVTNYAKELLTIVSDVHTVYGTNGIGLLQTGGLDNRTIFAALMHAGIKPQTFYGVGNSSLTNTDANDLSIVRHFAQEFSLHLSILDWSTSWRSDSEELAKHLEIYGVLATTYAGSTAFLDSLQQLSSLFVDAGYFGEQLRLREWAEANAPGRRFHISEFFDGYFFGPGYGDTQRGGTSAALKQINASQREAYISEIARTEPRLYDSLESNNMSLSLDEWNRLEWIHMRQANAQFAQLLNHHTNSFPILAAGPLHNMALALPSRMLRNARFQLALIQHLYPPALSIPVYSHQKRSTVVDGSLRREQSSRRKLLNALRWVPGIANFAAQMDSFLKVSTARVRGNEDANVFNSVTQAFRTSLKVYEIPQKPSRLVYDVRLMQLHQAVLHLRR